MTPKSLWIILIRIFGIYLIFQKLIVIPQLFITMFTYRSAYLAANSSGLFLSMFWAIVIECLLLIIITYCVFKPVWLIHLLKLDQGFDTEILEIRTSNLNIILIAIFVIGGIIIADSLPLFCRYIFMYYQKANYPSNSKNNPPIDWVIYYGIKSILGFAMIAYGRKIADFINTQSKNPEDVIPDNNA